MKTTYKGRDAVKMVAQRAFLYPPPQRDEIIRDLFDMFEEIGCSEAMIAESVKIVSDCFAELEARSLSLVH